MDTLINIRARQETSERNSGATTHVTGTVGSDGLAVVPYRRVLIVEDEAILRRVMARNLTGRGLVVSEAESAEAAVDAVTHDRPDLILLDINLPDRTGWDVLRELRRR